MSFEVELKYRVENPAALVEAIVAAGGVADEAIDQEDHYLAHPARDFAASGEALRLRLDGSANKITYKGPKLGGEAKTREEIEIPFRDGAEGMAEMARLMERLGFRPVAIVRKRRSPFRLERSGRVFHLAVDQADGLGTFAEVETIVEDLDGLPAARLAVRDLGTELGLVEVEPRSYLRMLLESTGALEPGKNSSGQA